MVDAISPTNETIVLLRKIKCELHKTISLIDLAEDIVKNIVDEGVQGGGRNYVAKDDRKPRPRRPKGGAKCDLGGKHTDT